MVVRAGPLTAFTAQVTGFVDMESVIALWESRKLCYNFHAGCNLFKSYFAVYKTGV
jgi:hypothetical protein